MFCFGCICKRNYKKESSQKWLSNHVACFSWTCRSWSFRWVQLPQIQKQKTTKEKKRNNSSAKGAILPLSLSFLNVGIFSCCITCYFVSLFPPFLPSLPPLSYFHFLFIWMPLLLLAPQACRGLSWEEFLLCRGGKCDQSLAQALHWQHGPLLPPRPWLPSSFEQRGRGHSPV